MSIVHIGCYTAATGGTGRGIQTFEWDRAAASLTPVSSLALDSPSWLLRHPAAPIVYATNEVDDGRLTVLRETSDGHLDPIGEWSTGGGYPCHLALHDDTLLCSNYADGSLAVFALDADGRVQRRADVARHTGHGRRADRQDGPHVHHASVSADGLVRVVDLGIDALIGYALTADRTLVRVAELALPPGFGPRQLVDRPAGRIAVLGELASAVAIAEFTADGPNRVLAVTAATTQPAPPDNLPAQLDRHGPDRLSVSNRGADCLTVLRVHDGPAGISVVAERDHPVGAGPRHVAFADGYLFVAAQDADTVEVHRFDPGDDTSAAPISRRSTGSPTFVLLPRSG